MFRKKTLFVVGAGCSAEYQLPLGEKLKHDISECMRLITNISKELEIDEALIGSLQVLGGPNWGPYLQAAALIQSGVHHASSIDRYLDFHQSNPILVEVGKLGIVRCIMNAEARSKLALSPGVALHPPSLNPNWLGRLFIYMQEGVLKHQLSRMFENVCFVCFNYDRCIEHYFFNALKAFAGLDDQSAAIAMRDLQIYHPYGRIGKLPWDRSQSDEPSLAFGQVQVGPHQLVDLSKRIRTYTERVDEGTELENIKVQVRDADQICFLGFSFLDQNMQLLKPGGPCRAEGVHGTVYNESGPNRELAMQAIIGMLGEARPVNLQSWEADKFLSDYGNLLRR